MKKAQRRRTLTLTLVTVAAGMLVLLGAAAFYQTQRAQAAGANIVVNSFSDTSANDGQCTLREAITAANTDTASGTQPGECAAGSGADTISFYVPGAYAHLFRPSFSDWPDITAPVTIDGYTQPGASPNTLAVGGNANILIRLDGSPPGGRFHGLMIRASSVTVRGLYLSGFVPNGNYAITIAEGTTGNTISGNLIANNTSDGALRIYGQNNVIGTNGDGVGDEGERNVFWANGVGSILIAGSAASGNVVAGNYIGLSSGGVGVGITNYGVTLSDHANHNLIGTNADGVGDEAERNVISANWIKGIQFVSSAHDNVVAGNYVGTDLTGTAAAGFQPFGVYIGDDCANNLIGTNADGVRDEAERNVISGGDSFGIAVGDGAHGNVVAGNYVGTDSTGTAYIGAYVGQDPPLVIHSSGILLFAAAANNRIGTNGDGVCDVAERNVISGIPDGIIIQDYGTNDNVVAGNYVGVDVTGTAALGG